ncbi:MAG: hypothetical protein IT285_00600 [Bdellovibrionales bacterium]|nr:hypothetical protein [Bdellovibrionales bacterium]
MRRLPFALAFLATPLLLGSILLASTFQELLLRTPPPPLAAVPSASAALGPPNAPVALVWLPASGVQLTELALAWETLRGANRHRALTVGESLQVQRTSGSIGIVPHSNFAEAPRASLLILPSLLGITSATEREWLRRKAAEADVVVALGTSVGLFLDAGDGTGLAEAGTRITSHFLARRSLEPAFAEAAWEWDRSWIRHGKWVSGWGLMRTPSAVVAGMAASFAPPGAPREASAPQDPEAPSGGFTLREWGMLWLHGGFGWGRESVGVALEPGLSDTGLAAILDLWPRSLGIRAVSAAASRVPVEGRLGLRWVAAVTPSETPTLDRLLSPGAPSTLEAGGQKAEEWEPGSTPMRTALTELRAHRGTISHWVERVVLSPYTDLPLAEFPHRADLHYFLRVLGLGLLGIGVARLLRRKEWSKSKVP